MVSTELGPTHVFVGLTRKLTHGLNGSTSLGGRFVAVMAQLGLAQPGLGGV
jgi:hypothetical protein